MEGGGPAYKLGHGSNVLCGYQYADTDIFFANGEREGKFFGRGPKRGGGLDSIDLLLIHDTPIQLEDDRSCHAISFFFFLFFFFLHRVKYHFNEDIV